MTDGINITQCSQPWWQTVGISLLFDIDRDKRTKMRTEEYDESYMSSSLMMSYMMMTSESTINLGNLVVCGLRPNGALQTVAMQIIILMTIMAGMIIIIMMTMMMMMS